MAAVEEVSVVAVAVAEDTAVAEEVEATVEVMAVVTAMVEAAVGNFFALLRSHLSLSPLLSQILRLLSPFSFLFFNITNVNNLLFAFYFSPSTITQINRYFHLEITLLLYGIVWGIEAPSVCGAGGGA